MIRVGGFLAECLPCSRGPLIDNDRLFAPPQVQELLASAGDMEVITQANPDQIAVAKCEEDSSWGRVKVEGIEGDYVKVRFLDFGSVELKRLEEIFEMPESVMEFPAAAFLVAVNSKDEATDENRESIYDLLDTGEELSVVLGGDKSGVFYIGERQVLPEQVETDKESTKSRLMKGWNNLRELPCLWRKPWN